MTPPTIKYLANWNTAWEEFPEKDLVTKQEFRNVLRLFHNMVCHEMMEGRIVKLPYGCGLMGIIKHKTPSYIKDFTEHKTNGTIRQDNLHTEGYQAKPLYRKNTAPFIFRGIFKFRMKRAQSRKLAQLIKTKNYIHKYRDSHAKYFN